MKKKLLIVLEAETEEILDGLIDVFKAMPAGFATSAPPGTTITVEVVHTPGLD